MKKLCALRQCSSVFCRPLCTEQTAVMRHLLQSKKICRFQNEHKKIPQPVKAEGGGSRLREETGRSLKKCRNERLREPRRKKEKRPSRTESGTNAWYQRQTSSRDSPHCGSSSGAEHFTRNIEPMPFLISAKMRMLFHFECAVRRSSNGSKMHFAALSVGGR